MSKKMDLTRGLTYPVSCNGATAQHFEYEPVIAVEENHELTELKVQVTPKSNETV